MSKEKYCVFSYDGHENECLMAEFDTLAEAQADCDARNAAEAPKRTGDVEDLYYVVVEPEPEPEWQYTRISDIVESWTMERDQREKVGSMLRIVITRREGEHGYRVFPYVTHQDVLSIDTILQNETYPTLHDAQQAADRWLTQNPQSVTCLDVGFDLRLDDRKILLPADGVLYYRYETKKGEIRTIRAHAKAVGEVLKKNGYKIKFKEGTNEEG